GGSSSPSSDGPGTTPQPVSQAPLTFDHATINLSIVDSVPANPLSGGSGSGSVAYSSSDPSVATVDDGTGTITLVAPGATTVTATKAADSNYLSASASYTLVITKAEQEPLVFAEELIEIYIDGTAPENSLQGGSGTGAIAYVSMNPAVAIVESASGNVTVQGDGTTQIVATKQGDDIYREGTAQYTLVINKYEQQALAFASDQISGAATTQAPENPLTGGEGDGEIVYSSSDSAVASVNSETGAVALLTEGSAIITAVKAGDALFSASQASYEIVAFDVISGLDIQVGFSDTRVTWETQHDIIETIRTSQYNCNVDNYPSCRNDRLRRFNQPPATFYSDTFPKIGSLAYLHIQSPDYRSSQIRIEPAPIEIPFRWDHSLTAFNDRLWIIGGETESITQDDNSVERFYKNDIWSSEDGATWKLETENAEFSPRSDHTVLEFNNELYLFSGWVKVEGSWFRATREVWKSSNGVNWEQLTVNNLPISSLSGDVTVFDGKFWAISSTFGDAPSNQIWSSEDGIDWKLEVTFAPFAQRKAFTLYTDDENIYMMGGYSGDSTKPYYDIWMSSDGVQWDQVEEDGGYERFLDGKVVRLDGKFYAMGGWGYYFDEPTVYISDNARSWSLLPKTDMIGVGPTYSVAVFKDRIWTSNATGPGRYIWTTSNGVNWRVPVDTSNIQWQALD
ncbi:MAG TPA: Ig-like domain-containing protein, partial [Cellvibrionaceae bacterium]